MRLTILFIGLTFTTLLGCSGRSNNGSNNSSSFSYTEEPEICTQPTAYSGGITITARAQFQYRQVTSSGLLGPAAPADIKFAEYQILANDNSRVQCGQTDGNGQINTVLPPVTNSYKLRIFSRANNEMYRASVLNNPTENLPYVLEKDFSTNQSENLISLGNVVANYTEDVLGGAFNILDQVYKANEYLRSNSGCPKQGNVCSSFTVAPHARLYWKLGLSPYSYYGQSGSGISFFAKAEDPSAGIRKGIYILGGIQGDSTCSDTDHFDNSVIIHEYGHFLEDSFAKSDSPGGSHNGNLMIDPRLSWSEGWANFIQAAVMDNGIYRDTIGNSSCSGGTFLAVNLNLEFAQPGQDRMPAGTQLGEGLFREVSISRNLFHLLKGNSTIEDLGIGFGLIWKAFSDEIIGLRNLNFHFRNAGLFNQQLRSLVADHDPQQLANFDQSLLREYQLANQLQYGAPLNASSQNTCQFTIQGDSDTYYMGNYISNLLKSNDFYTYTFDGSNPVIELHYSGSNPSDLDLAIYKEDYVYGDSSTIPRESQHPYPEFNGAGLEIVNLTGLAPGVYLINVKVNTSARANPATYYLSTPEGVRLCP